MKAMKTREEMELEAMKLYSRTRRTGDCSAANEADEIRASIALLYPPTALEAATKIADGFVRTQNIKRVEVGTRALNRLRAGDDPDEVIAEMRAEWQDAAHAEVMQAAEEIVQRAISTHNAQQWYGAECVIRMAAENHSVVVTTPCCGGFLYVEPHPPRH